MPRRRSADSGSHEAIGSRGWIVKAGFALLGTILSALVWAGATKLASLGHEITDLERRIIKLESHGHSEDPRIIRQLDKLETRVDRLERPRPWERPPR